MNTLLFEKQPFLERVYKEENLCKSLKVFFLKDCKSFAAIFIRGSKKGEKQSTDKIRDKKQFVISAKVKRITEIGKLAT